MINWKRHFILKIFIAEAFFFIFFLSSSTVRAQHNILGSVSDGRNQPIADATIYIINARSAEKITQTLSSDKGKFNFSVKDTGSYRIRVSHQMFEDGKLELKLSTKDTTLSAIVLIPMTVSLKDVTVEGNRPILEQKTDRLVFNVENSASMTGSTVLEALSKIPGVRVNQSNGVSLVGKGQVNVMIDDRLIQMSGDDLANYLRSMSSNEVSKIEVITNPPAKYDAAGNFGLINIVTKKKRQHGFNGSFSGALSKATYLSGNSGLLLNVNSGKLSVNSSFNISNNVFQESTRPSIFYPSQTWDQRRESKNTSESFLGRLSLDYRITKRQAIGLIYSYGARSIPAEEESTTNIFPASNPNLIDSVINARNGLSKTSNSNNINLHYEYLLDTLGKKFSIDGAYFTFNSTTAQQSVNESLVDGIISNVSNTSSYAPQNVNTYTIQSDISFPNKIMDFNFGGKLSFIKTAASSNYYYNVNTITFENTLLNNAFNYSENIQALYISGSKELGRFSLQLGLRAENTLTTGESITAQQTTKVNYLKIFPTAYLMYQKDQNNSFVLSYGKRINRPSYWYLNPFKQFVSPYFYYEGNPFLRPSFNNIFQLTFNHKNKLITKANVYLLNNIFDQIVINDNSTKISKLTRLNYYSQRNYGISQNYIFSDLKWLESYNSASINYISTKSNIDYASGQSGFGGDLSSNNTFRLNKARTITANADFSYTFPMVSGISKFEAYYSLDAGIKVLLNKKNLALAVNAVDILKTSKVRFSSVTNNIQTSYNNYFDSQSLRFSLNYSFGKVAKTNRQIKEVNNDESRRAN